MQMRHRDRVAQVPQFPVFARNLFDRDYITALTIQTGESICGFWVRRDVARDVLMAARCARRSNNGGRSAPDLIK